MRFKTSICSASVLVLIAGLCLSVARADEPAKAAAGKVSGVVMKDGKPVADARVMVMPLPEKGKGKVKRGGGDSAAPATQPGDAAQNADQARRRRAPAGQAKTDADGKFSIEG